METEDGELTAILYGGVRGLLEEGVEMSEGEGAAGECEGFQGAVDDGGEGVVSGSRGDIEVGAEDEAEGDATGACHALGLFALGAFVADDEGGDGEDTGGAERDNSDAGETGDGGGGPVGDEIGDELVLGGVVGWHGGDWFTGGLVD